MIGLVFLICLCFSLSLSLSLSVRVRVHVRVRVCLETYIALSYDFLATFLNINALISSIPLNPMEHIGYFRRRLRSLERSFATFKALEDALR